MVYTRIVQPGQKPQYTYEIGESLLLRVRGTVIPQVWWMCMLTMITTYLACLVYDPLRIERKANTLRSSEKLLLNVFSDMERTMNYLTGFVTFILGFFNSTVFYRWWKMRSLCGQMVQTCQNVAMQVAVFVVEEPPPLPEADTEPPAKRLQRARSELIRLLGLAQALALQACHRERDLDSLIEQGLLERDSEEHRALLDMLGPRYNEVWAWFIFKAYEYADEGMMDSKVAQSVCYMFRWSLCNSSNHVEDLMMHLNQPVPLAYCHLLELMVTTYVLILPMGLVPSLLWVAIFISPMVALFFYGFFKLGSCMLMDPFQQDSGFDSPALLSATLLTMESLERHVPIDKERARILGPLPPTPMGFKGAPLPRLDLEGPLAGALPQMPQLRTPLSGHR